MKGKILFMILIFVLIFFSISWGAAVSICKDSQLVKVFCHGMSCRWGNYESEWECQNNMWGVNASYCSNNDLVPLGGSLLYSEISRENKVWDASKVTGCFFGEQNRKCWGVCAKGQLIDNYTTNYNHTFIKVKHSEASTRTKAACYNLIPCDNGWREYIRWAENGGSWWSPRYHCVRVCVKCESGYVNRDNNWNNGCEEPVTNYCVTNYSGWVKFNVTHENCTTVEDFNEGCVSDTNHDGIYDTVCCPVYNDYYKKIMFFEPSGISISFPWVKCQFMK